jgi:hypothetical protein
MDFVLVVALFLAGSSPDIVVKGEHAKRALDDGANQRVVATPLKAQVIRRPGHEQLQIDVVRFGPARGSSDGAAAILVEVGAEGTTIPTRAPLEASRPVGGGLLASLPVRHRFVLPGPQSEVTSSVVKGGSGVGARLGLAPAGDDLELVSLAALPPLPPLQAERLPQAEPPPQEDPKPALHSPAVDAPLPAEADEPAVLTAPPRPPLPVRLSAQVAVGGMLQVAGGLSPVLASGGVRLLTGPRAGWLSRYSFGGALDFEHQTARGEGQSRWDASTTRLRLEAQARALELQLGASVLELSLLGGAGMILGAHAVQVGSTKQGALLLGPTFRAGAQAAASLGPGALVALVPLDLSIDAVGGRVQGFAPLAASLYVGYRLDL